MRNLIKYVSQCFFDKKSFNYKIKEFLTEKLMDFI